MTAAVTSSIAKRSEFTLDAERGFWTHPSHSGLEYSDGQANESAMLRILSEVSDRSIFSEPLAAGISNWPTRYHFSPKRHNLLRHLNIPKSSSILELGCGCGAITRQLGETGAQVVAVEGGVPRAVCAAARCRELSNVQVLCADIQNFDAETTFDIVTLIGVLEYAPVFFKSKNPMADCLKLARRWVKPGGVLLLAIENQLGLKYFCGAPEDHAGKAFVGVQDLYRSNGAQTFGRSELRKLLHSAGFASVEFQFPFPDYKLPIWVFTERAFQTPQFDPGEILRLLAAEHMGERTSLPADERLVWPVLQRNGLIPDLANSFLVIAGADVGSTSRLTPDGLLASGCVTERRNVFNTRTQIVVQPDGRIGVNKSLLVPGAKLPSISPPVPLRIVADPEPYWPGKQIERLASELLRDDFPAAIAQFRRWIDLLLAEGLARRDEADIYNSPLKEDYFDCSPRNLIVDGDALRQIDREWRYTGDYSVRNHALGYLEVVCVMEARQLKPHLTSRRRLAVQLAEHIGIPVSEEQYRAYKELRRRIVEWIVPERLRATKKNKFGKLAALFGRGGRQ